MGLILIRFKKNLRNKFKKMLKKSTTDLLMMKKEKIKNNFAFKLMKKFFFKKGFRKKIC